MTAGLDTLSHFPRLHNVFGSRRPPRCVVGEGAHVQFLAEPVAEQAAGRERHDVIEMIRQLPPFRLITFRDEWNQRGRPGHIIP